MVGYCKTRILSSARTYYKRGSIVAPSYRSKGCVPISSCSAIFNFLFLIKFFQFSRWWRRPGILRTNYISSRLSPRHLRLLTTLRNEAADTLIVLLLRTIAKWQIWKANLFVRLFTPVWYLPIEYTSLSDTYKDVPVLNCEAEIYLHYSRPQH
jgi:hypothetical protein